LLGRSGLVFVLVGGGGLGTGVWVGGGHGGVLGRTAEEVYRARSANRLDRVKQ